ncbi:MAG: MBL fold metallo-hydrolase [Thermoanaerobaculia bacterium]
MIRELSSLELLAELESETPPQLLDVRAPQRAAAGHIETASYFQVPGSRLTALPDPAEAGLDRSRPVTVVCDRGISSRQIAAWLARQGFEAQSLVGGMQAWMLAVAPREISGLVGLDRLVQFDRFGKGSLGYLAFSRPGSGGPTEALAVDPGRDLGPWERALEESAARLVAVVDTHCHADYLSGGPALASAHGVPYRLHPADASDPYEQHTPRPARISYEPLAEGDEIAVGDARFRVESFPGHTEGSVVLCLGSELALTGDFLFVASVGRPDLADRSDEWTDLLWASLERSRRDWAPSLRILPAHYSSEAERTGRRTVEALFGELAARNPPFAIADRDSFRRWIGARVGDYPEAYRSIKRANLGLLDVDDESADELETGKNQCALAG